MKSICEFENANLSPTIYTFLRNCPPASKVVERRFLLKKILEIRRNFGVKNVANYINIYYTLKVETKEKSLQEDD